MILVKSLFWYLVLEMMSRGGVHRPRSCESVHMRASPLLTSTTLVYFVAVVSASSLYNHQLIILRAEIETYQTWAFLNVLPSSNPVDFLSPSAITWRRSPLFSEWTPSKLFHTSRFSCFSTCRSAYFRSPITRWLPVYTYTLRNSFHMFLAEYQREIRPGQPVKRGVVVHQLPWQVQLQRLWVKLDMHHPCQANWSTN